MRIGARGSKLSLAQAGHMQRRIAQALGADPEDAAAVAAAAPLIVITTTGDRVQDRRLLEIGGKGLFTKEIEEAMYDGAIDLAVHSLKDVPTVLPDEFELICNLPREDPRDAFLSPKAKTLAELPAGSVVGTASLRRQALVLHMRPDLKVQPLRGNVDTRMAKLDAGAMDATLLAVSGLKRFGKAGRITSILSPEEMMPAVAQGAISVEARKDDERTRTWLAALDHAATTIQVTAERALLAALDGSCKTPIAALAEPVGTGEILLRALVVRPDGTELHETRRQGALADAVRLGADAGAELKSRAGPNFFDIPIQSGKPV